MTALPAATVVTIFSPVLPSMIASRNRCRWVTGHTICIPGMAPMLKAKLAPVATPAVTFWRRGQPSTALEPHTLERGARPRKGAAMSGAFSFCAPWALATNPSKSDRPPRFSSRQPPNRPSPEP